MVAFDSKTYSKRLLHLISWSHWFTFFNIIAAIGLSSFYIFSEGGPETFLGQLYLITTWFSHMGFLTFMTFVLILFPITLIFPHTRFIRATASVVFTIQLLVLLLDAYIYNSLGYHLNASSSAQILDLISTQIQHNSRMFWFISIVLTLAIFSFELTVSNYAWKHLRDLQKVVFAKFVVAGLVCSFFFSHLLHIWADANLEYDILRQDTVLPLSYPSTAKTLLTKYGMFDREAYIERTTSPLAFTDAIPQYPLLNEKCIAQKPSKQSVFMVVNNEMLTDKQIKQFKQRNRQNELTFEHHIDNALPNNAWFNLFYSLPSIYQEGLVEQNAIPLLFQALKSSNLVTTYTLIHGEDVKSGDDEQQKYGFEHLFSNQKTLSNISTLVFANKLNSIQTGLHLFYFADSNSYQFELFMDALLLAQKAKQTKDIIWITSVGNESKKTSLSIKPSLLILPESESKMVSHLTSHMDIQPTLMNRWLNCNVDAKSYSNGKDLLELNKDRIIANTMDDGIMVFSKDKSVFIDQNGNFQSYSRQLAAPIMVNSDFPLMIDGVNFIKQFSQQSSKANNK
jgi:membrane-anchored protein YejM (alkaline phosphatase superfamily)